MNGMAKNLISSLTATTIAVASVLATSGVGPNIPATVARQCGIDNGEFSGDKCEDVSGDKSGTTTPSRNERAPQLALNQRVAEHASFVAERVGFEPPDTRSRLKDNARMR